jgi:hypothetical protein
MTMPPNVHSAARPRHGLVEIWRWPLLIGAASGFGLVAALVADGILDAVAAAALAIPAVLVCWYLLRPRKP